MADETRDVDVALRVTKEGDPGAFKETAEDVRELRKEAEGAAPALDDLGESTSSAGEAAGEAAEEVGELGRSSADTVGKLADIASKAALVTGAFKAGWEAGKLLREGLNDLTDGEFDRTISGWFEGLANWVAGADEAAGATDRLRNAQNILVKNGIDPAGKSLAEMDAIIEELSKKKYEAAEAAEVQAKAEEAWAEKMGLSKKALEQSSTELAAFIAAFARANSQLSAQDLGAIFGKQVQEVLDAFALLKVEPPAAIAELARSLGIVTTEAGKAADAVKASVDRIVDEITGSTGKAKEPLEQLGQALAETLGKIDFDALDTAGLERAKKVFEEFIERSRVAGQQVPRDIADQAAALGVLVPAMEVAGGSSSVFASKQQEAGSAAVELSEKIDATGKKSFELKQKFDEAGEAARAAGGKVKEGAADIADAGSAGDEAASGIGQAAAAADALGKAGEQGGVGKLAGDVAGLVEPAEAAATALNALNQIDYSGAAGGLDGLLSRLVAIEAQAKSTKTALDSIDTAGS